MEQSLRSVVILLELNVKMEWVENKKFFTLDVTKQVYFDIIECNANIG